MGCTVCASKRRREAGLGLGWRNWHFVNEGRSSASQQRAAGTSCPSDSTAGSSCHAARSNRVSPSSLAVFLPGSRRKSPRPRRRDRHQPHEQNNSSNKHLRRARIMHLRLGIPISAPLWMSAPTPTTLSDWQRPTAAAAAHRGPVVAAPLGHIRSHRSRLARASEAQIEAQIAALEARAAAYPDRNRCCALPLFGVPFAVKDNIDVAGLPDHGRLPGVRATRRAHTPARCSG